MLLLMDIDVEPYVDFYKETDHYSHKFRHNDKFLNTLISLSSPLHSWSNEC